MSRGSGARLRVFQTTNTFVVVAVWELARASVWVTVEPFGWVSEKVARLVSMATTGLYASSPSTHLYRTFSEPLVPKKPVVPLSLPLLMATSVGGTPVLKEYFRRISRPAVLSALVSV